MTKQKGKILQVHIQYLHPGFILSVAYENEKHVFSAKYKTASSISDNNILKTLENGKKLSEVKARELFFLPGHKYA